MKLKNLAFFGVMAAILGINSPARADDATVIASKAYVDARDALKQDHNKRYENTLTVYNTLGKTVPEKQEDYPSMYTLEQAVGGIDLTSVVHDGIRDNETDTAPSENAVYDALADKQDKSDSTVANGTYAHITQGTGVGANLVSLNAALVSLESAREAGIDEALYSAWVDAGKPKEGTAWDAIVAAWNSIDNVVSDNQKGHQTKIPRNANIQKGIAYLKGDGIGNYTAGVADTTTADTGIGNTTVARQAELAWKENYLANKGDDFVPTVAAVERRVQEAESKAIQSIDTETTNVLASSNTTYYPTVASVQAAGTTTDAASVNATNNTRLDVNTGDDDHFYTTEAAAAGFTAVDTAISNMTFPDNTGTGDNLGKPVMGISQTNGKIHADLGQVGTAGIANDAVTSAKISDGSVQYQYDMNNTALYDINTSAIPASGVCVKGNPCVLTYYKENGRVFTRWTPMDTDGESANTSASTDAGSAA